MTPIENTEEKVTPGADEEPEVKEDQKVESDADDVEEDMDESEDNEEAEAASESDDEGMTAKYMRLMADFQNFKKRTAKEKEDIYAYANEGIMIKLFEVLDNFERALDHGTEDKQFLEGMEMIFKQLTDVLQKSGLEEIEALGQDFDPNYHNAVLTEDTEEYESGKVSGVMQKGYKLNNKVIRPSMVKVSN